MYYCYIDKFIKMPFQIVFMNVKTTKESQQWTALRQVLFGWSIKPLAEFLSFVCSQARTISVDMVCNPGTMLTCFRFSFRLSLTPNGMGGWNPPPGGFPPLCQTVRHQRAETF